MVDLLNHIYISFQDFHVICLDEGVLAVQQIMRRDFLARNNVNEGPYNDRNRHAAYVQFILWQHGRLGVGHMCLSLVAASGPSERNIAMYWAITLGLFREGSVRLIALCFGVFASHGPDAFSKP